MRVDKEIHFLKGPSPDSKLILSIRRDFRESLRWRKMLFIVELTKITHENSENIDYSNGPISKQHTIVFFLSLLQKGGYLHSPNMRHLKIEEVQIFSSYEIAAGDGNEEEGHRGQTEEVGRARADWRSTQKWYREMLI